MYISKKQIQSEISINIIRPVIWIVSYPRSGNTYLRSLLANYEANATSPLGLEQIAKSAIGEHEEELYFELTAKRPAERSIGDEMGARVAYCDRARRLTNPSLPMIKSHTLHGTVEGCPTFRFAPGDRIVHLVRHPCDVAISVAHYYDIDIEAAVDQVLHDGTYFNGHPNLGYEVIGSWSQHTRSWLEVTEVPVFCARYDDLVSRTEEVLARLVDFLGFPPEEERVARAAEFSQFSRLRDEEHKRGYIETAPTAAGGYFREGRAGQWLERLTIRQAQRILEHDPELIDTLDFQKVLLTESMPPDMNSVA